jgi:hypothetical protein
MNGIYLHGVHQLPPRRAPLIAPLQPLVRHVRLRRPCAEIAGEGGALGDGDGGDSCAESLHRRSGQGRRWAERECETAALEPAVRTLRAVTMRAVVPACKGGAEEGWWWWGQIRRGGVPAESTIVDCKLRRMIVSKKSFLSVGVPHLLQAARSQHTCRASSSVARPRTSSCSSANASVRTLHAAAAPPQQPPPPPSAVAMRLSSSPARALDRNCARHARRVRACVHPRAAYRRYCSRGTTVYCRRCRAVETKRRKRGEWAGGLGILLE